MLKFEISKRVKYYLYAMLAFLIIAFIIFNSDGLLKYFSLQSHISEIEDQIEKVEAKLDSLNNEIEQLRKSDKKIEQVAREKYNMHKSNETPIRVEKVIKENDNE
jgi:cell division protein FtsB